jgi:hypothetical protein
MRTKNIIAPNQARTGNKLQIVQKLVIAIVAGIATFFLSKFGIAVEMGDVNINLPWSLLFSIIVSLGYGWQYGLIAGVFGGALYPFLLWESNGYANIMTITHLFLLLFMIGKASEKEMDRPSIANRLTILINLGFY